MLDLSAALITQVSVHRVGNQSRDEGYFLSPTPTIQDDELQSILLGICQRTLSGDLDVYRFAHDVDISYHAMHGLAGKAFAVPSQVHDIGRQMVVHLYNQSSHPHVKSGDIIIIRLEQVLIGDLLTEALVIIKAENKQDYLKISQVGETLQVDAMDGIQARRMDKCAIICDIDSSDGYRILSVDNNNYDAAYWLNDFLGVSHVQDDHFMTRSYVDMCKSFAQEVVREQLDKKSQVDFVQQTIRYLDEHETVDVAEFKDTMFADAHLVESFDSYRTRYADDRQIESLDQFDLSDAALQKQKKKIRNVISLDTNMQIKLGFANTESLDRFVERGWDEEKGMYYYKCYFNTEK